MNPFLMYTTEILILIFLIITFLQSAIDKVIDWSGNLGWLTGHFEATPLAKMVPVLLMTVLLTEMAAGIFCAVGIYQIVVEGEKTIAFYGAVLSCIALLMLLFGQR
ncbi:MAG: DoxX family protein, partial [Flavobacteriaceae bacterium]|nr:DoxX family protein [Flavobacteriaceae bacterium]